VLHSELDVQNAEISLTRSSGNHSPCSRPKEKVWKRQAHDKVATTSD